MMGGSEVILTPMDGASPSELDGDRSQQRLHERLALQGTELELRAVQLELEATRGDLRRTQDDLEATRRELGELEALVRDLPQIYERKFQQRLQPLLDQQQLLARDNHALREQAQRRLPPAVGDPSAPAAVEVMEASQDRPPPAPPASPMAPLRHLLRGGRPAAG